MIVEGAVYTRDGKDTVIPLQKVCCVYIKPGRFSFRRGKAEFCFKQTGSRQRRDENVHIKLRSGMILKIKPISPIM